MFSPLAENAQSTEWESDALENQATTAGYLVHYRRLCLVVYFLILPGPPAHAQTGQCAGQGHHFEGHGSGLERFDGNGKIFGARCLRLIQSFLKFVDTDERR